jgi:hypothetical protein
MLSVEVKIKSIYILFYLFTRPNYITKKYINTEAPAAKYDIYTYISIWLRLGYKGHAPYDPHALEF